MNNASSLAVIRGRMNRNAVMRQLGKESQGVPVIFERSVLYPYLRFETLCKVPTLAGKKAISLHCLVDGLNGHGMTSDGFATDESFVPDDKVLRSQISVDDARRIARRAVTHGLGRKLKMIAPFDVRLEARGTVYKRFLIVRVGNDRLMVDSVSGHTQPLQPSNRINHAGGFHA